jgi:hypothetical protein
LDEPRDARVVVDVDAPLRQIRVYLPEGAGLPVAPR